MDISSNIIQEISEINKTVGAPDLTAPVLDLLNNQDKPISIAFFGQFKSGKSSLINSIINKNILPTGVVPLTSVVTLLRYGEEPRLIIKFENGDEKITDASDIAEFVTEKQNPSNVKKVDLAVLEHPSLSLFKHLCLTDTPGIGSLNKHNTEATSLWMPNAGAAVIGISAERPLSDEDIGLIKEVSRLCPDIAVVLTKTDLFSEEAVQEIRSYMKKAIENAFDHKIPLLEYSIVDKTDDFRKALVEHIMMPMEKDVNQYLHRIKMHKTGYLLEESIAYTELALKSSMKRESEVNGVRSMLAEIRSNRSHREKEMMLTGSSYKGEIRERLENIFFPHQDQIVKDLQKRFKTNFPISEGLLYGISRKFESWLNREVGKELKQVNEICAAEYELILSEIADYYRYSARHFRQVMDDRLFQYFGTRLPEKYLEIEFTGVDVPDTSVYRVFDSHLDTLLFFLPMKLFHPVFFRHFYRQIALETKKNLQRYISDLNERFIKSIDLIHRQALRHIDNEIGTVEGILQNKDIDVEKLRWYLTRLNEIKQSLVY